MTFEFVIACRTMPGTNIKQVLTGPLISALEDTQNDFNEGMVADMIQLRSERIGGEALADDEGTGNLVLIGFAVELPDETVSMGRVIDAFVESLPTTPPIFHAVKFEDPLLREELAERAAEIFELEMKLRRVLTIIYLYSYQGEDPFELLRDESEQPTAREKPTPEQMRAASENQFFHLTFGQYINLNKRQTISLAKVLEMVQSSEHYQALRAEILRAPVEDEGDVDLLADLKTLMNAIDGMRNCVAHNRRPTRRITDSYPNAHARLDEKLSEYLNSLASPDTPDGQTG